MRWWAARFADGRSAATRRAQVRLDADALTIRDEVDRELASWPLADLALVDDASADPPVRLKRGDDGDERLTVAEAGFREALLDAAPHLRGGVRRRGFRRRAAMWVAGVGVFFVVAVFGVSRFAAIVASAIPIGWEESLGDRVLGQIVFLFTGEADGEAGFCDARAGRAALERLTARLAAGLDTRYRFKVVVVKSEHINALALPGGRIAMLSGLIEFADSPDEVAGVLAHEMAHVVERHVTQAMVRDMGYGFLLEIVTGGTGLTDVAAGAGTLMLKLSFSRNAEAAADTIGRSILHGAGLRSGGLAELIDRLPKPKSGLPDSLEFLSSHPPTGPRAAADRAGARDGQAAMTDVEWRALGSICAD